MHTKHMAIEKRLNVGQQLKSADSSPAPGNISTDSLAYVKLANKYQTEFVLGINLLIHPPTTVAQNMHCN